MALENVPHSDGDLDDPFRYLASQITAKQEKESRKVSSHGLRHTTTMEPAPLYGAETATPSETSKRETLQTDVTTPMTTPGVTPAETGKRFSDVGKRPVATQPSNSRITSKPIKTNAVYSFLNEPLPTKPSFVPAASKSMTNLPNFSKERLRHHEPDQMHRSDPSPIGKPDFNKSLPAIPRFVAGESDIQQPKEKSNTITRMLKTVRLHRSQTSHVVGSESISKDFTSRQKELLHRPSSKKHKFNPFTFLQKRTSINTKRATVG